MGGSRAALASTQKLASGHTQPSRTVILAMSGLVSTQKLAADHDQPSARSTFFEFRKQTSYHNNCPVSPAEGPKARERNRERDARGNWRRGATRHPGRHDHGSRSPRNPAERGGARGQRPGGTATLGRGAGAMMVPCMGTGGERKARQEQEEPRQPTSALLTLA